MSSSILHITVDCADAYPLAQFWSQVLDRPIHPDNEPGDEDVAVVIADDRDLLLQQVPEPKATKNRLHLCLQPDQSREVEVDRLLALGASMQQDLRNPDGTGWAVLLDPEGNEFCVLRSAAERAATSS